MNLFEFNTDKMTWTKYNLGATGFLLTGLQIKITDDNYFDYFVKSIVSNLINNQYKLILVDHTRQNTYDIGMIKFVGMDYVNQKLIGSPNKNNVFIECLIREEMTNLTDINNYWLYLQYE